LSFVSLHFIIFFPIVVCGYFLLPHKLRWLWLLVASYVFYMSWNPKYAIFLGASTLITYLSGILIGRANKVTDAMKSVRLKKIWVFSSFAINIGILAVFKYLNFFNQTYVDIVSSFGVAAKAMKFDLLLPVGISFYIFQALTYTIDVYRGDVKPVKHLGKYALFVSFFPQIIAGPIEKSKNMLHQFDEVHQFDYDRAKKGLLLMLWGFFEKMVVADRLGELVNTVYSSPQKHFGLEVAIATVFFTFQIYCDFAGYSNIALGAAKILGFRLSINFDNPYFSKSIQEFWRRWHISLGAWFKDYLYIPLGGNRCSKFRHCLNIIIVFSVCGLWHGASINFVIWGLLHGLYQVIGLLLKPAKENAMRVLKIKENSFGYNFYRVIATFLLVDFAWIFFRAETFGDVLTLLGNMFKFDPAAFWNGSIFNLGLPLPEFLMAVIGIVIVLVVGTMSRNQSLCEKLLKRNTVIRWTVYLTLTIAILIFGIYGSKYDAQQFIYTQF